jgi:signal transduction histidine kinase
MRRHVDRALARARLAYASRNASADVKSVVDRVVRVVERTPQGEKLDWEIDVAEGLAAPIEAEDLGEALGNLIENSVRHARARIAISAGLEAKQVFIAVTDDGPGIAVKHRSTVVARGQRLDTQSEGAGLGLAIVSDIVEAWGGRLILDDARPGLIVKLQFRAEPEAREGSSGVK